MRLQPKTDKKINIVGIDDHKLTGLDVATDGALVDTQKGSVIGVSMNILISEKGELFMVLDKSNGLTAK